MMKGPFPRCADVLLTLFANAVARTGRGVSTLELDEDCNEHSDAQWRAFVERGDSLALMTWCADKINYWDSPKYIAKQIQTPIFGGITVSVSFKIMSPDGLTDWTLVAWHIHVETHSTLPFTSDVLQLMEDGPAITSTKDIALLVHST